MRMWDPEIIRIPMCRRIVQRLERETQADGVSVIKQCGSRSSDKGTLEKQNKQQNEQYQTPQKLTNTKTLRKVFQEDPGACAKTKQ